MSVGNHYRNSRLLFAGLAFFLAKTTSLSPAPESRGYEDEIYEFGIRAKKKLRSVLHPPSFPSVKEI